jgi:hypothetical protein
MNPPLPLLMRSRLGFMPGGWGSILTVVLVLADGTVRAQESLRNSLAGEAAAAVNRQQFESQLYTYKTTDFKMLAIPSVEVVYNDNVNLSKHQAQADEILIPFLNLSGTYLVSHQNQLSLAGGVGYSEYLEHGQYSRVRVDANSELSLNVYVNDFSFNLHDRYSMVDDPGDEAAVSDTAYYGLFVNSAGATTTWDLRDLILTLGYDHQDSIATSGRFSYIDNAAELPLARAGYRFNSQLTAGVEGSASFTSYDQHVLNDNSSYSGGVYADWTPGKSIHLEPRVGYAVYLFDHTSLSVPNFHELGVPQPRPQETLETTDLSTWYAELTLTHAVTKAITYGLNAGHEIRLGINSDAIEDSYFRPNASWAISRRWNLNTSLSYEHGVQGVGNVSGNLNETYDWFGGSFILSYLLVKKLMVSLNYRYTLRSSTISDYGFAQNSVGLKLSYQP